MEVQKVVFGSYRKKMGADTGVTLNGKKQERKLEMCVQYPAIIAQLKSS
jgi:hypothetical protein